MPELAGTSQTSSQRAAALADLVRSLAAATNPADMAGHTVVALRRAFPIASAAHVHERRSDSQAPQSLLVEPDPLASFEAAVAVLRRVIAEKVSVTQILPDAPGQTGVRLSVAPVVHGDRLLGTLALTLPSSCGWTSEDEQWLGWVAEPLAMGLAIAQMRDREMEMERRHREMSEAVEARAQARVEQLAGRGRQLEALFQLSTEISHTLDEAKVTAMALDHLVSLTGSRSGFVAMADPAGAMELSCVRGVAEEEREILRVALSGIPGLLDVVTVGGRALRQNCEVDVAYSSVQALRRSGDRAIPPEHLTSPRLDSLLAVPLSSGNRSLGALVLIGRLPGYDEADERLVSMFGLQVAVAVQNARMVAKIEGSLQTRRRELTSLSRMAQELASATDEAKVVERAVAIIRETFDARSAWLMLRDEPTGPLRLRVSRAADAGRETPGVTAPGIHTAGGSPMVPADRGIVGETLRTLAPVFRVGVNQNNHFPLFSPAVRSGEEGSPWGAGHEALLGVPLVVQDRALGVLVIDSARFSGRRPPRPQDFDLIQAFASQAAVAIENARLVGGAVRRTRRERLLNEIMGAVREPTDVSEILSRAAERLGRAMEVSRCVVLLPQENGEYREHVWTEPGCELPTDEILWESCPVVQRLEETGQPLALTDASEALGFGKQPHSAVSPLSLLGIAASRSGQTEDGASGRAVRTARPAASSPRRGSGVLFLFHQCDRQREWSEDDLSLAQRVISQVAVAVENARLYEQELKREQFQRTMAEIATAVGSSVELNQVLRAVGEQGMRLLSADAAYIWRLEEASREMVSAVAVGHKADKFQNLRLALTRRSFHVVKAALERRPIAAHGIGLDRQASQRLNRMFDCQSLLAVPLLLREQVIGVVQFSTTGAGTRFDEEQVAQAGILVSQAAAAVENAQLYEAERDRAEELEVLWRIGQEIAENLQPERIFTSIVAGARRVLGVEAASLMMFEEDDQTLSIAAQEGLSPEHVAGARFRRDEGIPRCIGADGAHRLTPDLAADPRYPPEAVEEGLQSMLSVPMQDGTQIAGALNVYTSQRRPFRVEEAQKLDLLASFAMAALRQARQFRRERKIAQVFQRDLLPELKLEVAGFDVAPKSIAALTAEADVGGDFYDVHPISESKIGLAIGDVSGKGLAAAPRRAMVKCVLRAFAFESPSPSRVLERLNRLLHRTMESEQFVTLFYGVLDIQKGELTYANAGHELPLVLRRGSGSPELLETTGPLLALDSDSAYRQVCTPIGRGDTLVLYTDGFTEARRGNDFLQVEGLASLLDEFREGSAGDMVESISESVSKNYGSLRDDATILVVKSVGVGD